MRHQDELATKPVIKLLIQYSVPAIIGMMVNALYNVVDRMFIGNIPGEGSLAITGVGITMPISTIILACGMLVGIGTTANISIKLGQGQREVAQRIIGNNITLSIIISLVITIFGLGFKEPILRAFGASEQTLPQVISNNTLKNYGGDLAIGAMATISSISLMFLMPIFGINQGSQPIIGYNYGARQYSRVRQAFLYSLSFGTFILAIGFIVVEFFPTRIISLFNSDPELMAITVRGIRIYLFMLTFVSVSIIGSNFFQSIGKARLAIILSLLRQLILFYLVLLGWMAFGLHNLSVMYYRFLLL